MSAFYSLHDCQMPLLALIAYKGKKSRAEKLIIRYNNVWQSENCDVMCEYIILEDFKWTNIFTMKNMVFGTSETAVVLFSRMLALPTEESKPTLAYGAAVTNAIYRNKKSVLYQSAQPSGKLNSYLG